MRIDGGAASWDVGRAAVDPFRCFVSLSETGEAAGVRETGDTARVGAGSGSSSGGLDGLPFAAKDNLDTVDLPTTANTPGLLAARPRADNPAIEALRRAGAVLVGKTSMHELALGITTNAAAFPATRNPADSAFSAGGSSGGSAAAVASGAVPFALGTDTGGSITIPAAWCGVYGLRPSSGRWPSGGVVPLSPTRDTVGVFAASLELLADVDAVVCGIPAGVATATGAPLPPSTPLRLGVPHEGSVFLSGLAAEVRAVWDRCIASLEETPGIDLVGVGTDELHALELRCGAEIEFFEISHALTAYLARLAVPVRFEALREQVARSEVAGLLDESLRRRDAADSYRAALSIRARLQRRYEELFAGGRLAGILYPSTPIAAPRLGAGDLRPGAGPTADVFEIGTRNVNPGSVAGQPVVCVPAGRTAAGLPVGASIEGPRFGDRALLRTADAVASALLLRR